MTKAMVLAAGVGSRLEPISSYIPKPLVPVLNVPVMERILKLLHRHGITDAISNTHYLSQKIHSYFEQRPIQGLKIKFFDEPELTGDAGGVRAAREFLQDETFVVIMGDLITNADIGALVKAHKEKHAIATIAVKQVKDVTRFGVMKRNKDGFIEAFQEKPAQHEAISNEISTGIYILEPAVFDHIPSSGVYGFGRQLFPSLVSKGLPVLGAELDGFWSDIGTIEDLFNTNLDALTGKISLDSPPCFSSKDPVIANAIKGKRVLVGDKVQIGERVKIGDYSIIGNEVQLGNDVQLDNCLVLSNSSIPDGSKLSNCIYAFGNTIQMQARMN